MRECSAGSVFAVAPSQGMIDDIVKSLLTDGNRVQSGPGGGVVDLALPGQFPGPRRPPPRPPGPLRRRRFGMLRSLRNAWRSLMARQPLDVLDVIADADTTRVDSTSTVH